jgi:murein DD-endopeptidase MepM/ murein hydrolase activator NlpD
VSDLKFHTGLDLRRPEGTPVFATGKGTVLRAGSREDGYGIRVVIDHGDGVKSRYAHLASTNVKGGDRVKQGDQIGAVGVTGRVSGAHLHFEIMVRGAPVDPEKRLPALRQSGNLRCQGVARDKTGLVN